MKRTDYVYAGLSVITAMFCLSLMILYLGSIGCTFFGIGAIDFLVAVWGLTGGISLLVVCRGKQRGRYKGL